MKGKVMANGVNPQNPNQPTSFGKPHNPNSFSATLWPKGTDPYLTNIPTKSSLQQLLQFSTAPLTAYRQAFGYNAPSIEPIAREEQRRFQQETLPQLMENFAAGGSQGGLLRGIQGAQGDIATKLAALRQQQQFELQKLQQEQLPRMRELELSPTFQPHISNMPLKQPEPSQFERGVKGVAHEIGSNAWNELLNKTKEKAPAVYSALTNLQSKYEEHATPWTLSKKPPLPEKAKENEENVKKNIAPQFKNHINPELMPYIDENKLAQINRVARKRARGESKGYDFFNTIRFLRTPAQVDQWLKIMTGGVKRDKTRKAELDKFLKQIGAINA